MSLDHADPPGAGDGLDDATDERVQLAAAPLAAPLPHDVGEHRLGDDAGEHGIFEVVAHVRDAVGPRHDLAFGGGRRRPGPRVVADAVECLGAEVERGQHHVGAPHGVVVPAGDVGGEGVLGCVAPGPVPAVVAEGDGLGEGHVEAARAGDGGGDLGDLERMGQAGALVVVGEDEDLGLSGESAEGRGAVQDPVAVALEAGAERVGGLVAASGCRLR